MAKTKVRSSHRLHPMIVLLACGCIVAGIIIAGMSQSVAIANYQYELARLKSEFDEVQQIGQHLQLKVAQLQSLERIEAIARNELGMVEPSSVRTIVLQPKPTESVFASSNISEDNREETPNRYLAAASRFLARFLPALEQAEAGKLGDR